MIDLSRTIENLIEVGQQLEVAANLLPDDLLADDVCRLVDELLDMLYENRVSLDTAAPQKRQR